MAAARGFISVPCIVRCHAFFFPSESKFDLLDDMIDVVKNKPIFESDHLDTFFIQKSPPSSVV